MNRAVFFDTIRPHLGPFAASQVEGFEKILDEAAVRMLGIPETAYILATAWWESASTMQPIREKGGEKYLKTKKYYPWVGEGLVQVTWKTNHMKFGATKPGQMLTWPIALRALFDGMLRGMFTGKKVADYIKSGKVDYRNARKIVNGMDRADEIAGFAVLLEKALRESAKAEPAPVPPPPVITAPLPLPPVTEPRKPPPPPPSNEDVVAFKQPSGFWAWLKSLLS